MSDNPPRPQDDLRLQPKEIDERAQSSNPFFKLWVKADQFLDEKLVYVDTSEQQMLYNPITYTGTYETNLSIVMVIQLSTDGTYTFSSIVLPKNKLEPSNLISNRPGKNIYNTTFDLNVNRTFHRLYDAEGTKRFAFYTEINDQRAYLLPIIDDSRIGKRKLVIGAVQTDDSSPNGKYVFSFSESPYKGPLYGSNTCSLM